MATQLREPVSPEVRSLPSRGTPDHHEEAESPPQSPQHGQLREPVSREVEPSLSETHDHNVGAEDVPQLHDDRRREPTPAPVAQSPLSRTPDPPQTNIGHGPTPRSKTCPRPFVFMFSLLLLGVLTALAHHLFYSHLNGRSLDQGVLTQPWVTRIGNAFAFAFKTVVVTAIGIAYAQMFWFIVRRQVIPIRTLDSLFGVLNDPLMFFDAHFVAKMTPLFLIAGVSWILPLSAILSPGAITVTTLEMTQLNNYYVPVLGPLDTDVGFIGSAASVDVPALGLVAAPLTRVVMRILTGSEYIGWESPCGVNCSYVVSFTGPAYQCVELGPPGSLSINLTELSSTTIVSPESSSFLAVDDKGTSGTIGLWVVPGSLSSSNTIHCILHNATYTTNVTYLNNIQSVETDFELHEPINPEMFNQIESWTTVVTDALQTNLNMYAIHEAIAGLLSGYVFLYGKLNIQGGTMISMWAGVVNIQGIDLTFIGNVSEKLTELMLNTTLSLNSLLQDPPRELFYGNKSSPPVSEILTPANVTTSFPIYTYFPAVLWEIYGTALGLTMISVIVGSYMLRRNAVDGRMSFSQILVTTRNPTLDRISEGAGLGGQYIEEDLLRTPLTFGLLKGEDKICFGTATEITQFKK